LAEAYGRQYSENKWQSAWLQYSRGPCVTTVGRQALIWGAVDGVFAVDIITPFDYTEQLFTDYSAIRLGQDMAVSECFFDGVHTQVFYTPEARMDLFQHHRQQSAVQLTPSSNVIKIGADADSEWLYESSDIITYLERHFNLTSEAAGNIG